MKENMSKEEAMQEYLENRRKADNENAYFRSILQVIVANIAFIVCLFSLFFSGGANSTGFLVTIIIGWFAIELDKAFYHTYLKKENDESSIDSNLNDKNERK